MNKGFLIAGIILLGVIALLMYNTLTDFSRGSELDYYLIKETTDAAMEDSIDLVYLRTCGLYRIDKEKFVENFIYRFANGIDATRDYEIRFYDINEVPPKVSVQVDSLTVLGVKVGGTGKAEGTNITTSYDAILETNYYNDLAVELGLHDTDSNNPITPMSYEQCRALVEK